MVQHRVLPVEEEEELQNEMLVECSRQTDEREA